MLFLGQIIHVITLHESKTNENLYLSAMSNEMTVIR